MAKNYMDNLTSIGTKVAFAAAMTAALAMPASADEIEEIPAPQPEAPVVEDPTPVAPSSDVQEVTSYNETVTESNSEAVADNTETAGTNESTGSDNQAAAESNQEVPPANDTVTGGNQDTVLDNNTTDGDNQEAIKALDRLLTPRSKALFLAHISGECNEYDLVKKLAGEKLCAMNRNDIELVIPEQHSITRTVSLRNSLEEKKIAPVPPESTHRPSSFGQCRMEQGDLFDF